MSTTAIVPLQEYLNTVYRPDRDYVEGRLEKRNVGEWEHADLQAAIAQYLRNNAERFRVLTVTEIRVKVAPARYRVADVCCVRGRPVGGIVTEPPVLCVEVLSPKDRIQRIEKRIADYQAMGVRWAWVINPGRLDKAWIYQRGHPRSEVSDGVLTTGEIRVPLFELPRLQDFDN